MIRYMMLTAILMATTNVFSQNNVSAEKTTPTPAAIVGGFMNGADLTKNSLTAQAGIGIYWKTDHGSAPEEGKNRPAYTFLKVTSFQATVIRNGSSVFNTGNTGNVFNEKTRSFFNSLEPGDIVLFSGIKASQQDGNSNAGVQETTLKPLLYTIK